LRILIQRDAVDAAAGNNHDHVFGNSANVHGSGLRRSTV
jgi:hypothetical protein